MAVQRQTQQPVDQQELLAGRIRVELRIARKQELEAQSQLSEAVRFARSQGWDYDRIADAANMPRWMVRERFRD